MKTYRLWALLWLTVTGTSLAWDGTGHMIIAQIARDRLTPKARARVDALAAQLENHHTPYNGVTLACWADDIKDKESPSPFEGQFKPWHYLDLGCSPSDPNPLAHPVALTPTKGDLVTALSRCVTLIREKKTDALVPNEAVALALVMHLAGDAHQPLHTTCRYNPHPRPGDKYKDDAGGNLVTVANLADTPWGKNLHTFWDEAYRRFYENGEVKALPELHEATALNSPEMKEWLHRLAAEAPAGSDLHFDAKKWVLETHELGCAQAYGALGEPYGARNITFPEKYVAAAAQTARRQLVLAGHRLAALLNDLYGN